MTWAGGLAIVAVAVAACASAPAPGEAAGVLTVTAVEAGGPVSANAGTPSQPAGPGLVIKVAVQGTGTGLSAVTNGAGVATFSLPGGSYYVSSASCGTTGRVKVTVQAARSTSLTWVCPIP